jgi:hypothetical protein
MAWGTPTDLGGDSAGTGTFTVTATAPVGSLVVAYYVDTFNATGTISDSKSNSYTPIGSVVSFTDSSTQGWNIFLSFSVITSVLTSATDTIQWSNNSPWLGGALFVSGPAASPLDTSVHNTSATGASPLTTTALTPAGAGELFVAVGLISYSGGTPTFGAVSGFTKPPFSVQTNAGGVQATSGGAYQVNAGSGALTWNPVLTGGTRLGWGAVMAAFKAPAVALGPTVAVTGSPRGGGVINRYNVIGY